MINALLTRFDEQKLNYIGHTSATEWALARQHAQIVAQYVERNSSGNVVQGVRDRSMAENIRWILDQEEPDAKWWFGRTTVMSRLHRSAFTGAGQWAPICGGCSASHSTRDHFRRGNLLRRTCVIHSPLDLRPKGASTACLRRKIHTMVVAAL